MKMLNTVVTASTAVPVALSLYLASPALRADTEFGGSVPLEVAMQFVGGNPRDGSAGKLYSDIFAAFPAFDVPADFTVLASADQGVLQRVILRTDLDEAAAQEAIAAALVAANWSLIPDPGLQPRAQGGFVTESSQVPQYQQFCHDELGRITAAASAGDEVRYVNLTRNANATAFFGNQPTCAQLLDPGFQQFGPRGFAGPVLAQYVPRLVMPQANAAANAPQQRIVSEVSVGGSGGGSQNEWEARGTLYIDWSIDDIAEHFVQQIEDQGWKADAEVTGSVAASASWTKSVDDMELTGVLLIAQVADTAWDLRFRILRRQEP